MIYRTVTVSVLSAVLGYLTYTRTGLIPGALTVFMSAWLLFQFRSLEKAWRSLGNFQNPLLFGINSFFAAYIYLSFNQVTGTEAFNLSFAAFLLGGAASLLITKYWNP